MINKINYTFSKSITNPYIEITTEGGELPSDCILEIELFQLSTSYLKEIVEKLEKVEKGELDYYEFGFETTLIWCYKKGYKAPNGNFYPDGDVTIYYNYGDDYLSTDLKTKDILQMMIDWRDYVLAWEKEIGKVKK